MDKLCLILAVHNHQPVGNFDAVFEEAYQRAYLPFLKTLERHPDIRMVLHYSGSLLSWIKANHPGFLASLKALADEGRVELLTGGFYEPLLSAIPEKDRIGQIRKLTGFIRDEFGYQARGMWLAERVWEPEMPEYIARSGVFHLPVDDHHFRLAGLKEDALSGYFITESNNHTVRVFPGSEELRYLIPFKKEKRVISYLKKLYSDAGSGMISMADDGEKFGIWPDTYKLVYTDGWLDRFFRALTENSDWLETTTYRDYISKNEPLGRVYLPGASYREMGEWSLLPQGSGEYEADLRKMKNIFDDKKAATLIRGGVWKNFLVKYPEANHIHKRMVQVSGKVRKAVRRVKFAKKPAGPGMIHEMLNELWQSQCNDAYWHGVFGGLYLPHLRSALYRHLLKAEKLSEDILGLPSYSISRDDIDKDGYNDLFISTSALSLFFTERGGNLCELSYKDKAVNILDTLSRRHEPYHKKILKPEDRRDAVSIHENIKIKDKRISLNPVFDSYRKTSLIDHFLPGDTTFKQFRDGLYKELWDQMKSPYAVSIRRRRGILTAEFSKNGDVSGMPVLLEKKITVHNENPAITVQYNTNVPEGVFFCTEFNLSFLGSPYPAILIDPVVAGTDKKIAASAINSTKEWKQTYSFAIRDDYLGISLSFKFDAVIDLWHFPVETVSLSEGGLEKIYQGTTFIIIPDRKRGSFAFDIKLSEL